MPPQRGRGGGRGGILRRPAAAALPQGAEAVPKVPTAAATKAAAHHQGPKAPTRACSSPESEVRTWVHAAWKAEAAVWKARAVAKGKAAGSIIASGGVVRRIPALGAPAAAGAMLPPGPPPPGSFGASLGLGTGTAGAAWGAVPLAGFPPMPGLGGPAAGGSGATLLPWMRFWQPMLTSSCL